MSARYASFPSQISSATNEAKSELCSKRKTESFFAVQRRVLLYFLATVIELLYGAKGLNAPSLVHRKVSKTFENGMGEF